MTKDKTEFEIVNSINEIANSIGEILNGKHVQECLAALAVVTGQSFRSTLIKGGDQEGLIMLAVRKMEFDTTVFNQFCDLLPETYLGEGAEGRPYSTKN